MENEISEKIPFCKEMGRKCNRNVIKSQKIIKKECQIANNAQESKK
ncbi:MAG: hypothetical protein IJL32_08725 [Oscillospiraceae bacterium]|nr:hypothetical protein [Oscillospiraceae bacterium]